MDIKDNKIIQWAEVCILDVDKIAANAAQAMPDDPFLQAYTWITARAMAYKNLQEMLKKKLTFK